MARFYVTVSIPYVNARPHLGYALELVQADVLARWRRQAGDEVRFLGGTDDHALKNVLAAEAEGVPTRELVDRNAARFQALQAPLAISFDDFIRTSGDPRHAAGVERLWRRTAANGDFYRRHYEGHYCVGCEQFYAEADLESGRCREHRTRTEWVSEENWFFRLSRYQDQIERLLARGELVVVPEAYRNEALAFVRAGLDDISVSRSVERARGWGVPVPGDPGQVVYVWWDALGNYVSALDYGGDADDYRRWWLEAEERVHVIGKGILRFHAIYWPALLLSAGEPPPTKICVHPYLTVDGQKLSKSSGNVVDPTAVVARYGTDALRWWLASEVPRTADTDFTTERLVARANDDLANALGNVVGRVAGLVHRFRGGTIPCPNGTPRHVPLLPECDRLSDNIESCLQAFDFRRATATITEAIGALNRAIETTRPWELAQAESESESTGEELDQLLACFVRTARAIAVASTAFVPGLADRLRHQLGSNGPALPPLTTAFPRIPDDARLQP